MFRLNLKIALRNLWKNKGYTTINVLGLAIGMASCILIFLFIRFQLSFDEGYKNEDRIYRFVTDWKYNSFDDYSKGVAVPHVAAARNEIPGIEKVAALFRAWGIFTVKDRQGKEIQKVDEMMFFAEPDFFDIFNVQWYSDKPGKLFQEPNTVVLSESMAAKLFGSADKAVGNSLGYGKTSIKVVGVIKDMPENSSFPLKILVSYETFWDKRDTSWDSVSSGNECYVLLKEGVTLNDVQGQMKAFNDKYYHKPDISGNQTTGLQPLRDIHFNDRYGSFNGDGVTKNELYALGVIGWFLILTACINFINLATAQAVSRSKEVGVRKVMGSRRSQLVIQFLTETVVITLIALVIACVMTELVIPGLQKLVDIHAAFGVFRYPVIFLFLGILVIGVAVLAGAYPALVMSGFSPALAIKNKVAVNTGNLSLRKVLVVVQFAVTIILIISTIVIIGQMEYIRNRPTGFNSEHVLMVNVPSDSLGRIQKQTFINKLASIPGISMWSNCSQAPMSERNNTTNFSVNGVPNKDFEVRLSQADREYFRFFGLTITAGKIYARSDTLNGFVVNETFLKKIHVGNPLDALGKVISFGPSAPIVAVVKDFNDHSLREEISPLVIYQRANNYQLMAIKINSAEPAKVEREIEQLWATSFPQGMYHGTFLNEDINKFYKNEQLMSSMFRAFAAVIMFISFIGLFGLISFVASQRTKEVAIRKVLGASTFELVKMLNSSFLLMVFIANLLAWPLAYLFVKKWLAGFAYQMNLNVWPFVLAMCISMIVTLITVSLRSYKAALSNPIDALKYE